MRTAPCIVDTNWLLTASLPRQDYSALCLQLVAGFAWHWRWRALDKDISWSLLSDTMDHSAQHILSMSRNAVLQDIRQSLYRPWSHIFHFVSLFATETQSNLSKASRFSVAFHVSSLHSDPQGFYSPKSSYLERICLVFHLDHFKIEDHTDNMIPPLRHRHSTTTLHDQSSFDDTFTESSKEHVSSQYDLHTSLIHTRP